MVSGTNRGVWWFGWGTWDRNWDEWGLIKEGEKKKHVESHMTEDRRYKDRKAGREQEEMS